MVEHGKELRFKNVLSLRKKIAQNDINGEILKIGKYLNDNGLKKVGPVTTVTFAAEVIGSHPVLDIEILVPVDKVIEPSCDYCFKNVFHLVNAVYLQHKGNPSLLQDTYNQLTAYIKDNKFQQITAAYNVNVKELQLGQSMDEMIVDVYIGVNPSLL
jgi:effector-binding domain-containing protein